ncbi:MAG: DUF1684 domain-containing protein [Deltaproteobacteria bacterium]|nr:DUF1684 domain-containing protein [Deltaproteobacteria bacterium]
MTHDDGRAGASARDELLRWQEARNRRLVAEWGWLSLVDRFVLSPGDNTIDVGNVSFLDGEVTVRLRPDVQAHDEQGHPVTKHRWPAGSSGGGPFLLVGRKRYELLRQGDHAAIRVRDNDAPSRTAFPGLSFFPHDERFDVVARLDRTAAPTTVTLGQGLGGSLAHSCPGALVFLLDGREHRLLPVIEDDAPGKYFLLFRDRTNGTETYGAGRFLYLEPADADGRVRLDFNRAFNPPCALTPYAACPVVPPENVLTVAITAGERAPPHHPATAPPP